MPTYTIQAKVINQKKEAIILNLKERFEIKRIDKIIPDKIILKPKPPKQPKNKNDCNLLSLTRGSMEPNKPYIINPVNKMHIVQTKYSILLILFIGNLINAYLN